MIKSKYVTIESPGKIPQIGGLTGPITTPSYLDISFIISLINAGKVAMENPCDYEARATLMWASTLSHNGLTGTGKEVFLTCHQMAHEINGIYDTMAHGETLAIVFPAWATYMLQKNLHSLL